MEEVTVDVLVLGSGAAGLRAAIAAREAGLSVCVASKGNPGKSTCTGFSGGVMAAGANSAQRESHLQRTLIAGRGLNDRELAKILTQEAPLRLNELMAWGMRGEFRSGYLYAGGRPPVLGEEIVRSLLNRCRALGVCFLGGLAVADLLVEDGAVGAGAFSRASGEWVFLSAGAAVLAAGGAAALYLRNDNPGRMLGDGCRLALEAGATLRDMEFVQFYPLCLAEPGLGPMVIPPKLADCGRLVNDRGEDILEKYGIEERPAGEKARDRLSQALFREVHREGSPVRLDLRDVTPEEWRNDPFATALKGYLTERCGVDNRPLRVAPAAHHSMGGVAIDASGTTSAPGLFAAGESAGGVHGANRMGGNALSETLVFGARAGSAAADWAKKAAGCDRKRMSKRLEELSRRWSRGNPAAGDLLSRLRKIMWEDGGIIRNEAGLLRALSAVRGLREEASGTSGLAGKELLDSIELRSAARVSEIILEGALKRRESRGAHFREDYPEQNDGEWLGRLEVSLAPSGEDLWRFVPRDRSASPA